jgi:hypothetical protein
MQKNFINFSLLLIICLSASALAQTVEEQSGVIKTAKGILIVSNEPGNIYTLEVNGFSIEPIQGHPLWFKIDGKFFQIVTAEKHQFLNGKSDKGMNEKALLVAHQRWESDYLAETLKRKLQIRSDWPIISNRMTALAWNFDMPVITEGQTAATQLYLTVVKGDRVFVLNSAIETNSDLKAQQAFLVNTMATLKPGNKPLSLKQASEQVLKGN